MVARYGLRGVRVGEESHPGLHPGYDQEEVFEAGTRVGRTRLSPNQDTGISVAPSMILLGNEHIATWQTVTPTSMQAECHQMWSMLLRRI